MFAGDVYYCWSCDAHCRALPSAKNEAYCPRCREVLSDDCRLSQAAPSTLIALRGPTPRREPATTTSAGLWPTRAAAMH